MDVDVNELAEIFFLKNYVWHIDGVDRIPTAKDIQDTLDVAKKALYNEPVPATWEAGRLIVRRWNDDKFDVYLQMGILP